MLPFIFGGLMKKHLTTLITLFLLTGCAPSSVVNGKPALKEIDGKEASVALKWIFSDATIGGVTVKNGIYGAFLPVVIALASLSIIRIGYKALIAANGSDSDSRDVSISSILRDLLIVLVGIALYILLPSLMQKIVAGI